MTDACTACHRNLWTGAPDGRCDPCYFREEMEREREREYLADIYDEERKAELRREAWADAQWDDI